MKRYIYALLCALLFAVGCDDTNYIPDVAFYFGKVTSTTTDSSATVEILAYMTVDEKLYDKANVSLQYWKSGDEGNVTTVSDYTAGDEINRRIFTISDLESDTLYLAYVVIDGGAEYGSKREIFSFTTQRYIAPPSITCDAQVAAKGIKATVNLTNVAYIADEQSQQISLVKLEYSLASKNSWSAVEVAGSSVKNGKVSINIPKSGSAYLQENSEYNCRVTITPANDDYEPLTTELFTFKTKYAEVTADVAKPQLSYGDEGITIKVGAIDVYYDGVATEEYTTSVLFRAKSSSIWEEYASAENKSVVIPVEQLKDNTTYEAKVAIVAGSQSQVRESAVATITTPQSETPILPEPPTGGDTSSIAGVWHLTSWRGAEPSFEVYLDITATGGLTLYQRIDSRYWDVYQSTAYVESGVISGVYTDNVAWSTSYNLAVAEDTMTWTSTTDPEDVSIYTRSTLPTNMPTASTRAASSSERFL